MASKWHRFEILAHPSCIPKYNSTSFFNNRRLEISTSLVRQGLTYQNLMTTSRTYLYQMTHQFLDHIFLGLLMRQFSNEYLLIAISTNRHCQIRNQSDLEEIWRKWEISIHEGLEEQVGKSWKDSFSYAFTKLFFNLIEFF